MSLRCELKMADLVSVNLSDVSFPCSCRQEPGPTSGHGGLAFCEGNTFYFFLFQKNKDELPELVELSVIDWYRRFPGKV